MTTTAPAALRNQLSSVRGEIRQLREERAEARKTRDSARERFAGANLSDSKVTGSEEFKRAERAVANLRDVEGRLDTKQQEEVTILSLLGEDIPAPGANGPSASDPAVKQLTEQPGAWLSSVLRRRAGEIPALGDDIKARAQSGIYAASGSGDAGTLSLESYSSVTESDAVFDLLAPRSVAMASGIPTIRIETTKTRVPRFTELPEADWIAELGPFPKSAPGLEMVESEPPKVGLVSGLSIEVFDDLSPLALAMIQANIIKAVALAYDRGILFGTGVGDEPLGIANTEGVLAVEGDLTSLGAFSKALAALIGTNALPTALAINPLDFGVLLELTEFDGDTASNVPLLKGESIPQGFTTAYLPGVRWFLTPAAPEGTAVMYDPTVIAAVLRKQADIAVDPYYGFDNGEVGLRTYVRGDVVTGQVDGVCTISLGSGSGSGSGA
jgi:HK97 family phage major capsid protein